MRANFEMHFLQKAPRPPLEAGRVGGKLVMAGGLCSQNIRMRSSLPGRLVDREQSPELFCKVDGRKWFLYKVYSRLDNAVEFQHVIQVPRHVQNLGAGTNCFQSY